MIDNRLAINNFLLESKPLFDELDAFHSNKKRQIEHCFQKLLDNVPKEIMNVSINQCIKDFLELYQANHKLEIKNKPSGTEIEQSICDSEDLNNQPPVENLTSTVKKVAGNKKFNFKDKLDHMLNEQSMIKEVNSDEDMESPSAKDKTIKQVQPSVLTNNDKEDYKLKIIYFLKDLTKVTAGLTDLSNVNLKNVHENSLGDVKRLKKVLE